MDNERLKTDVHAFNPARTELYTLAEQKGVGISVMKTYGGGKLILPEPFLKFQESCFEGTGTGEIFYMA